MAASTRLARKAHLLVDFLAVVEEGGIRQAAERIHLSQSALTRRIQELEDGFEMPLFERTTRGMTLTRSGELLLRHARSVAQSCADAAAEIADLTDGAAGELCIAVGTAWAPALVPDAVARLRRRLPALQVSLLTQMGDALQRLADGQIDVVVGAAPLIHHEVVQYEPLLDIEQHVFASSTHPLQRLPAIGAPELAKYPWIWLGETLAMRPPLDQYFAEQGLAAPTFALRTSSVQAAMRLLKGGDHLMLLPSTLTRLAADSGLAPVRLDRPLLTYSAGLIYRPGSARLRSLQLFRQCLGECLAELGSHMP